jgi:hypothetical protein
MILDYWKESLIVLSVFTLTACVVWTQFEPYQEEPEIITEDLPRYCSVETLNQSRTSSLDRYSDLSIQEPPPVYAPINQEILSEIVVRN